MQAVEVKKEGQTVEYKVTVTAAELADRVKARLQEITKTAKIAGFRPGKAPLNIIEKRYGDAVLGEVVELAVNDGTNYTITENKLRPAGQPRVNIEAFAKDSDLEFTVALDILPEIKVMELKDIKLERPVAKVADEAIEEALNRIASNNQSSNLVERAAQDKDIVVIDYDGKLEDGTSQPGMASEGYSLALGSGSFIPGFEEQLIGSKAGDTVDVKLTFPDPYHAAELAGQNVVFAVKVHEVREPAPAEINDEFAKSLGTEDLNALKGAVREQMESEYGSFSRHKVKRALFDLLDEKHQFDLPQSMVDMEFQLVQDQINQERAQQGEAGELPAEELEELKEIAERRVRLGLVLSEIGQANNITVTDQDLQRAILDQARRFPGQEAQIFDLFQKNKQMVDSLRAPIFEDKVVDFILELADIADKEVSIDELTRDDDEEVFKEKTEAKKKKASAKKAK